MAKLIFNGKNVGGSSSYASNVNYKDGTVAERLNQLIATDNTPFRFGVTEDGKYGYIINKDGADTVIPFSEGGADTLYQALQYSGLVTPDMSFEQMCVKLAEYFPAIMNIFKSGQGLNGSLTYELLATYQSNFTLDTSSIRLRASANSQYTFIFIPINTRNYKKLTVRFYLWVQNTSYPGGYACIGLTDKKEANSTCVKTLYLNSNITKDVAENTVSMTLNDCQGDYYFKAGGFNPAGGYVKDLYLYDIILE